MLSFRRPFSIVAVAALAGPGLMHADASVQPYVADANTIGLWHLDETNDPPTTFADASGNNYTLTYEAAGSATVSAESVAGLFGQGVTGFRQGGSTDNLRLSATGVAGTNPATQTFEAWMMWENEADLPQNTTGGGAFNAWQTLMHRSQHQQILRLEPNGTGGAQIHYRVRTQAPSGGTARTEDTYFDMGEILANTWYHLAVSMEEVGDDLIVRMYWNDVNTGTATPNPVVTNVLEDFTYDSRWWNNMWIGGNTLSGVDGFAGIIDEVRLSNIARTEFNTLVPEPAGAALWLGAAAALMWRRRRVAA
ncbi:LamG-like jellyroll fold domain-containing protein [Phycisphaerales bacterium AB-hyl4]|uniref:LamG-like jellyroll fold domain-containing protein n=1 Tax=Natronomicrosphaera hydrolytica TaxID=3242702 RepID=A0ABV4UB57_9BACT